MMFLCAYPRIFSLLLVLCLVFANAFQTPSWGTLPSSAPRSQSPLPLTAVLALASDSTTSDPLKGLKVAVVGGGPSGLLLAHRLLLAGATVDLYEKRPRPVGKEKRAYALGVGIRGRTAIQTVDQDLWEAVKKRGFASERFILHIGPLSIRLRDEKDGKQQQADGAVVEPSLLLFQSDLCRALADELVARYSNSGRMKMKFDCGVTDLSIPSKTLKTANENTISSNFDVVVGCDGVNSIVRKQMDAIWTEFNTTQELLPGVFKVVRLSSMPPNLDPSAVQLLFPKSGAVTAFVEPTAKGTCCVLFAGRNETDVLLSSTNQTAIIEEIEARYPKLIGADLEAAAKQLIENGKASQASLVTCNTFHYDGTAVLAGDAAHATGGVSGQGVNSALLDSALLADCLCEAYDHSKKDESLNKALLMYSQRAVPEGKALYDLSFGPKPSSVFGRIRFGVKSALDFLFKGKFGIGELPLQTKLTTSLESFADIRKSRDKYYEKSFPDQAYWNAMLEELDAKSKDLAETY